jgi:hypothetical protein
MAFGAASLTNRQGQILFCEKLPDDASAVSEANGTTVSVGLDLSGALSIEPFEGSRFVRGGRYGISIDFCL